MIRADEALFEIRPMTIADLDAVRDLEAKVFTDAWSREAFEAEVTGGRHCRPVVLEDSETGAVVGYMVSWLIADEAHLGNVAVDPAYRRRGLGQRLLDHLMVFAENARMRLITLEVRRSNRAAQSLYEKNGFYPVLIRRRYYSDNQEDALVMVKMLRTEAPIPPRLDPGP